MGTEESGWGLGPLGGDSEDKDDYTDGDLPLGVSNVNHRSGTPTMGSNSNKIGWRASGNNRRTMGSLDAACKECEHACLHPKHRKEHRLKLWICWLASHDHRDMCPSLSCAITLDLLASWCRSSSPACGEDRCGQRENLAIRHKGSSDLKKHLNRVEAALTNTHNRQCTRSSLGHLWPEPPHPMSISRSNIHSSGFCLSISGAIVPGLGMGRIHT